MEPDSSWCYSLKSQEATGANWNTGLCGFLSGQTRAQVAQRGCGVSIIEGIQNTTGQGPKQSALFDPAFTRGVDKISYRNSFQSQLFCDYRSILVSEPLPVFHWSLPGYSQLLLAAAVLCNVCHMESSLEILQQKQKFNFGYDLSAYVHTFLSLQSPHPLQ